MKVKEMGGKGEEGQNTTYFALLRTMFYSVTLGNLSGIHSTQERGTVQLPTHLKCSRLLHSSVKLGVKTQNSQFFLSYENL